MATQSSCLLTTSVTGTDQGSICSPCLCHRGGTFVEVEKLVAARKAGMSFAELHRRAYAGEFPPSRPMDLNDLI